MKKICLILILTCISSIANAYDFCVDGIYYNIISIQNRTVEVTDANQRHPVDMSHQRSTYSNTTISIPSTITYKGKVFKVIGIGTETFLRSNISNIKLPEGLEYIKAGAFTGCSIEQITLPKTLKKIGMEAFKGVGIRGTFSIPGSVVEIGTNALPFANRIIIEDSNSTLQISSFMDFFTNNLYIGRNLDFDWNWDWTSSNYIKYKGYDGRNTNITITIGGYVKDATQIINSLRGNTIGQIIVQKDIPPLLRSNISKDILLNVLVKVPNTLLGKYQNAQGWRDFFNLEGK